LISALSRLSNGPIHSTIASLKVPFLYPKMRHWLKVAKSSVF